MPTFQVRLFAAGNTHYRVLRLRATTQSGMSTGSVISASWHLTRLDGYADATLTLAGRASQISGLVKRRRVEFWAPSETGALVRLYRGEIHVIEDRRGETPQVVVTLYGVIELAGRTIVDQAYAFPYGPDLGSVWSQVGNDWVAPRWPSVVISGRTTGQTTNALNAQRRSVKDLLSDLVDTSGGFCVAGCDVVGDSVSDDPLDPKLGSDRLFLRPFGTPLAPSHTLLVPDPKRRLGRYERREEIPTANVLYIMGGPLKFPNLLAEATSSNTGFDLPEPSDATNGNLLVDPGFEDRSSEWHLGSGASFKAGSLSEGPTDGGEDMVELDGAGEIVYQLRDDLALEVGHEYVFQSRLRLERGVASATLTLRIIWKDSGGTTIQTDTRAGVTPPSATWDTYRMSGICPTGADQVQVEVECTAASGTGALVDNLAFYDANGISQVGWWARAFGGASVDSVDWACSDGTDGADPAHSPGYFVRMSATASDADGDDVHLAPQNLSRFPVPGNQSVRISFWARCAGTSPKVEIQSWTYNSGGSESAISRTSFASGSIGSTWERLSATVTAPSDAVSMRIALAFRGSGTLDIDSASVRDSSTTADEYVRAAQFETIIRADVIGTGDVADSITDWGELPVVIQQDQISTQADAEAFALAYFARAALPIESAWFEMSGPQRRMWPGEYLRAIGESAADLLTSPLPVIEIDGTFDGGIVTQTVRLAEERASETRVLRAIAKRELTTRG